MKWHRRTLGNVIGFVFAVAFIVVVIFVAIALLTTCGDMLSRLP